MSNFSWDALGKVTSEFGNRTDPINGADANHHGIDIKLFDSNIPAILGGTVIDRGTNATRGNYLEILQTDGTTATYMHMKNLSPLTIGTSVEAGETIGVQGTTGRSTGVHLHYQVQDASGNYIDPRTYETTLNGGTLDSYSVSGGGGLVADTVGWKEKINEVVGVCLKFIVLVCVGLLAGYLFFKAFDIKLF